MNNSNNEQLSAVAQSCEFFDSIVPVNNFSMGPSTKNYSCRNCSNWDGKRCTIDVYDNVLTSLDQE